MFFLTKARVEQRIDRLLSQSEGLAHHVLELNGRASSASSSAATDIMIDAKILHEHLLSLGAQLRFGSITKSMANLHAKALEKRLSILSHDIEKARRVPAHD